MFSRIQFAVLVLPLATIAAIPAQAIQRVASKFGVLEVRFGYAMPLGDYGGFPGSDFEDSSGAPVMIDGSNLYKDGLSFSFGYGQIVSGQWMLGASFDYSRNQVKNPVVQPGYDPLFFPETPTYNHYALALRTAFVPLDLRKNGWSPFLGPSFSFGLAALTAPGYITEYETTFGIDVDFGFDAKLWEAPDGHSFATLSSINSWNFYTTGERVSHLQIGGGIKYFFKP